MKLDCRTMVNSSMCPYLYKWGSKEQYDHSTVCTCTKLNDVVFPIFSNKNKITQEVEQIKPLFDCPYLQKMRVKGIIPSIMATITEKGLTGYVY